MFFLLSHGLPPLVIEIFLILVHVTSENFQKHRLAKTSGHKDCGRGLLGHFFRRDFSAEHRQSGILITFKHTDKQITARITFGEQGLRFDDQNFYWFRGVIFTTLTSSSLTRTVIGVSDSMADSAIGSLVSRVRFGASVG